MTLLKVSNLSKSFFGVQVLDGVHFELNPGEVLGLVGENGAGKSTIMKILGGVHHPDGGSIELNGQQLRTGHPLDSERAGIATVYQEFNLLPNATVAENIFLGREPSRFGVVNRKYMDAETLRVLSEIGVLGIKPNDRVGELSIAQQQMVEIAKALSMNARIIQMDEPTSALADHEVQLLYKVVTKLKSKGIAIIYVSHRIREILSLCDRVVVLKDGVRVTERQTSELTEDEIIRLMVGRPIASYFPPLASQPDRATAMTLRGCGSEWIDDIHLDVRVGEVLGIAGLQGSGRTEVLAGIFGSLPFTRGEVTFGNQTVKTKSPRQGINLKVAMIPEDRKREGLQLEQSIRDNGLAVIRATQSKNARRSSQEVFRLMKRLEVVANSDSREVKFLSGGNQQKIVLAKWLITKPNVVLFDEPTRGIDVGAKVAIYNLMRELAESGLAVIMVSSELPEIIGMSDRIAVMRNGRLVATLEAGSSEMEIMASALDSEVLV